MLQYASFSVCFFFFQAEDGIRDLTVTGVQTCALPICRSGQARWPAAAPEGLPNRSRQAATSALTGFQSASARSQPGIPAVGTKLLEIRSEERRVGEEGRSRGAPDH